MVSRYRIGLCSVIVALTPRNFRLIPLSHQNPNKRLYDARGENVLNLQLKPLTVCYIHPLTVHSGGSNPTKELSICLHAYVGLPVYGTHLNKHIPFVDSLFHNGSAFYRSKSAIQGAGLGLFTRFGLNKNASIEFAGELVHSVPDVYPDETFYLQLSKTKYLKTNSHDLSPENLAPFANQAPNQSGANGKIVFRNSGACIRITKNIPPCTEILVRSCGRMSRKTKCCDKSVSSHRCDWFAFDDASWAHCHLLWIATIALLLQHAPGCTEHRARKKKGQEKKAPSRLHWNANTFTQSWTGCCGKKKQACGKMPCAPHEHGPHLSKWSAHHMHQGCQDLFW